MMETSNPSRSKRWPKVTVNEGTVGMGLVVVLTVAFVVVPMLNSHGVADLGAGPLQGPSLAHPFGTDSLGRDLFVRVFAAGRSNLTITAVSVLICLAAGSLTGVAVGCAPRPVQIVVLRVIDSLLAIPSLVVVLALVMALGSSRVLPFLVPGVATVIVAIVLVGWAPYARLAAAQTLTVRQRESVIAARLLGYSPARVVVRHIMPSVMGVCVSYAATQAVYTTGLTASLAFLGSGIQEPTPELGAMMHQGIGLLPIAWWVTILPGIVVLLLGIGFALMADAGGSEAVVR